jgi:ATP-dependent RNA helicase DeaD
MTDTQGKPSADDPTDTATTGFAGLNLPKPLLKALEGLGYESPSPIQAQAIPLLLDGKDLLGHAPTGTGKTAAFALPLLARLDLKASAVQILTLTPTRELAIQVAEAFQSYAAHLRDFHVLPVYGGQEYHGQIKALRRGVHVIVGTPGRVTDHIKRGTLKLDQITGLVLDEADEMLRMGFIDDVEWILEQTPSTRQTALFSATMPKEIERIARKHLRDPQQVSIKSRTATAETIRQRAWIVSGTNKLDALTRILEVEDFDAILIFVRTRSSTTELADRLSARGYTATALNGDMPQKLREQTVNRLKARQIDILIATDVAARGLDVDRISHVINYDIPYDTESYIHRIGRTGRAGRTGEAILFAAPRERRMLKAIEKATRKSIEPLELPSIDQVNAKRVDLFKQRVISRIAEGNLDFMRDLIGQLQQESEVSAQDIAAALAHLSLGGQPLLMEKTSRKTRSSDHAEQPGKDRGFDRGRREPREFREPREPRERREPRRREINPDNELFRLEVGHEHGVQPGNIVGAIANEAGIDANNIGRVAIHDDYSEVELPKGMPREIFEELKKAWVCGRRLNISRVGSGGQKQRREAPSEPGTKRPKPARKPKLDHKDRNKKKNARKGDPSKGPGSGKGKKKGSPGTKGKKKVGKGKAR